jgi:flagellar biosynthesis protein FlhF
MQPQQLQTFQGVTMAEALHRVKVALGVDAVILHTRAVPQRRWMGLKKFETYEITASRNVNVKRQLPARPAPNPAAMPRKTPTSIQQIQQKQQPATLLETPAASQAAYRGLTDEVAKLKGVVSDLVTHVRSVNAPQVPEGLFDEYQKLVENMVAKELAQDIIASLQKQLRPEMLSNKALVHEKLAEHLEKLIPTTGPIVRTKTHGPHIVALIGPTGVGKTTTIAKLAANLKLREKRRVGLITIDTFRIAAIDQLKRYADILGAPLRVVGSPEDIKPAIEGMSDCEFILIDTAGRSPKDSLKLVELKQFMHYAEPDDVYLVLSTTSCESAVELAVEEFSKVRVDKLIFTKIDEAAQLGVVLNVCKKINKGLAYVTNGQNVPDDIREGHGKKLAHLILGTA